MDVLDCVQAYLTAKRSENLRPVTLKNYQAQLMAFVDHQARNAVRDADLLEAEHVRGYLLHCLTTGTADTSVRQIRNVLVGWLKWCVEEGFIDSSEDWSRRVPPVKVDDRSTRVLTPEEASRLLQCVMTLQSKRDWMGRRNTAMLAVLLDTGVRKSELLSMRKDDLFLVDRRIRIRAECKGRRERMVPFGSQTLRLLRAYLRDRVTVFPKVGWLWVSRDGAQLSDNQLYDLITRAANRCGLRDVHPHTLRHSCATLLIRSGLECTYVQELLGHRRLETTRRYVHILQDDLVEQYRRHSPLDKLMGG